MNDRPSIYTSFHCDLFESVGIIYMGGTEYGFMLNQDRNDQERKLCLHISMHDVLDFFVSICMCVYQHVPAYVRACGTLACVVGGH